MIGFVHEYCDVDTKHWWYNKQIHTNSSSLIEVLTDVIMKRINLDELTYITTN